MSLASPSSRAARPARPAPARGFLRRFWRARTGSTAVEFSLISIPFMILMFGVIELTMLFLTYATLESATEGAARQIRTGEFQTGNSHSKADFKTLVCNRLSWMAADCASSLYIDVRTFSNFASLAANSPSPGTAFDPNATCFTTGAPTDIVLVRTYFKWKLFTPLIDSALQNMGSGSGLRLISTATAFRNEPYNEDPPVGAGC